VLVLVLVDAVDAAGRRRRKEGAEGFALPARKLNYTNMYT
jgi:hypothetical protein